MRWVPRVLSLVALFVLVGGLEWEGSRARWLREVQSEDEGRRIDALHGLAELEGPEVDAAIVHALEDASSDVRVEAAIACEARALEACGPTLGGWLESTDAEVRAIAARALGSVGTASDVPRLARVLGDARPQVRRAAVLGLRALGGAAAVQALITALTDADPIVRERAVTALGEVGGGDERTTSSTALLSLVRDEAPEVRAAALDALGALGDPRTGASATVALDDDVIEVRLAAMRALTLVPSSVATAALVHASTDEDREGRAALAALARAPGAAALDAIIAALSRQSVARTAEDALEERMRGGEAARVEGVEALARAFQGASPDLRARLAGSASRLSIHVSIAGLEEVLAASLREGGGAAVLEALGRTGAEPALVPILDALGSDASSTRSAALSGLEGLVAVRPPDGRVLDPLSVAFPRLDESEQARAVTLVGAVTGTRATEWLVARLGDAARPARIAALRVLRSRAPETALPRLVALTLDDADPEIRSRAALVLADPTAAAHVPAAEATRLAAALDDDAPHDRQAILLALGPITRAATDATAIAGARRAMLHAFDADDPELADAAAHAIAASGGGLVADLCTRGEAGPTVAARSLRALVGVTDPRERDTAIAFATARLDAPDPRVAIAAYELLGALGDASAVDAIAARASALRFPIHAAAAFALVRIARRHAAGPALATVLASFATSHDPYVRADVAVAAAYVGLAAIPDGPSAVDWLSPGAPPMVRAAAARWAFAMHDTSDRVATLLASCATDIGQPSLARACAAPSLPTESDTADVIALDTHARPSPDRLVALRLADGSALVTYTDARGRVRLADAPAGSLSLDAPESAVLVP